MFRKVRYGEYEITVHGENDNIWFKGKDVAKAMGYINSREATKTHVTDEHRMTLSELSSTTGISNKNDLKTIYIDKIGMLSLLTYSKLPKDSFIKWYRKTFRVRINIIKMLKEQETIEQLRQAFRHTETLPQYSVGSYRIDLYFPEYNIAVECDEHGHCDRDQKYEITRQNYIEEQLKCIFVRFNPDAADFNIFHVISDISSEVNLR